MSAMDPARDARFPFVPTGRGAALTIERAEGALLYTREGKALLDAAGGAIVANIGHGRAEVAEVAARELERLSFAVPVWASESRLRLVERLQTRWLPGDLSRVLLVSGGSESVDAALRLARQHHVCAGRPERWKIIGRDFSYHGTTLAGLAVGGHPKRRKGLEPLLSPHPKAPACHCDRCPLELEHPACEIACVDAIEACILREGPETVAAVIAEPVGGSTLGAPVPPDGYWQRLREICDRHGVLLIADEVMTGFGRTGRRFAVEHWDVVPDILVGGKGLAGGYAPMGGVYARDAVLEPLADRGEDVMYYTYGAHAAGCAVADKVLEILERESLVEAAAQRGEQLRKALAPLEDHPHVASVRGLGLLQAVELVRERETGTPFPREANLGTRVVVEGLARGVFFYPGGSGPSPDVVCLGPPFIVDEEQVGTIARVLREAIDAAVAGVA